MINMSRHLLLNCTHAWKVYRADCLLGEFDDIPNRNSCKAVTLAEETESLATYNLDKSPTDF